MPTYQFDGAQWAFEVDSRSEAEAAERAKAMGRAELMGEIGERIFVDTPLSVVRHTDT